jgi:hypothetical protein
MKEWDQIAGEWVDSGEVAPFVQVALRTRERKILHVIGAAVLSGSDVLDL